MKDVKMIDTFRYSSTHFKGKFTQNVKNVPKNDTNFSLDSEKIVSQIKKGVKIEKILILKKRIFKIHKSDNSQELIQFS